MSCEAPLATPEEERAALMAQIASTMVPRASLDPTSPMYGTTDEAASAAFGRLTPGDLEQAGVIYQMSDGKYAYSIPTTQNQHDHFALRAATGNRQKLSAIYHTHPGTDVNGQYFSPNDIEIAKQLAVPSYVQFLKDGSIRSFTTGKTKTQSLSTDGNRFAMTRVAHGDPLVLPPSMPVAQN